MYLEKLTFPGIRFSLRGLLIAVTVFCCWLATNVTPIRERHAVMGMIEAKGGLWRSPANNMFPGPEPSLIRIMLGDVPLQRCFWLAESQKFTEIDLQRIKRAFPEATVHLHRHLDPDAAGRWNSAEPWPTVQQNRREREWIKSQGP